MKPGHIPCECTKPRPDRRPGCLDCRAHAAARYAKTGTRVVARMARLDEWVSTAEIADAMGLDTSCVSDALGYLLGARTVEKRRLCGEQAEYRLKQRKYGP